jgi:tetratricopeptide (TPR) repeat protein
VVVTPFEDLDALSRVSNSAKAATNAFSAALTKRKGIRALNSKTHKDDPWSAEDWKQIGEAASARFVLGGSVRERTGKKRLALHLIETSSGTVTASLLMDASSSEEAARLSLAKIAGALGIREASAAVPANSFLVLDGNVDDVGGTANASARGYYERGKEFLFRYNLSDQIRAIDSFRTAIKLDPNYAQAHAMLATACELRSTTHPDPQWHQEAEAAIATALHIAPMLPEVHRAAAENRRHQGHIRESFDGYLTAYELDPSSSRAASILGYTCTALGRPDLAIYWYEKAERRESRPVYADNIAAAWLDLGDYEQAEKGYRTAAEFRPDLPVGALGLSMTALLRGDYESARKQCEEARRKYSDNPQPLIVAALIEFFTRNFEQAEQLYREASASNPTGGIDQAGSVRFLSAIGFIRKNSGHEAEGQQLLKQARTLDEKALSLAPDNPELMYSLAADYAALDDRDTAIDTLDKAIAAGWIDYQSPKLDPRFDSVRDTDAFKQILSRLNTKLDEMKRQQLGRKLAYNSD